MEGGRANLECAADTEDTVVGLLGGETLDSLLDDLGFLGDQVIEPGNASATGSWSNIPAGDIRRTGSGCDTPASTTHQRRQWWMVVGAEASMSSLIARGKRLVAWRGRAIITSVQVSCSQRRRCTSWPAGSWPA